MTSPSNSIELQFEHLGPGDYDRAKSILNRAKHPGFVGRELFYRCATAGVVCVARMGADDVGVALVTKEKLQALSVVVAWQGKGGIGSALMRRLRPKWVSAIEEKVAWFERLGYRRVGAPKVGQNGKHSTQLLELAADGVPEASHAVAIAPRPKQISKAVLQLRQRSETVAECAKLFGVSSRTYFRWLSAATTPRMSERARIAELGGPAAIDWDELIASDVEAPAAPPIEISPEKATREATRVFADQLHQAIGEEMERLRCDDSEDEKRIARMRLLAGLVVDLGDLTGAALIDEKRIVASPAWARLWDRMCNALEPWPDAMRACADALLGADGRGA